MKLLAAVLGTLSRNFEKKVLTRSGRMEKSFFGTFSKAVFLFPVIKSAEKVSGFVFFRKERENVKKKKKENFFFSFRELFHHFWSLIAGKDDKEVFRVKEKK